MTQPMNKTEKCRKLVAKFDGKIKVAELVAKIVTACEFNTEMAARTYLNNARKFLRENPVKVAKPRKSRAKAKPETEQAQEAA